MTSSSSSRRAAAWPALGRRWGQYVLLTAPAVVIAGLASQVAGPPTSPDFLTASLPYLWAWAGGSLVTLTVGATLVWLMSRGSGFRVSDLEPERGASLLLAVGSVWLVAGALGLHLRRNTDDVQSALLMASWMVTYFNGLLSRRILAS